MLGKVPKSTPPPNLECSTDGSSCTPQCTSEFAGSSQEKDHLVQSAVCATASFPANVHNRNKSAVLQISS